MVQIGTAVSGQHPDADAVMKENAAAAALVDVAASFGTKASDSASSPSAPLLSESRKQWAATDKKSWDREQAAPSTDPGISRRTSNNITGGTATSSTTTVAPPNAETTNATGNSTDAKCQTGFATYHQNLATEHHTPYPQVPGRLQPQPSVGAGRADAAQWPSHPPPPAGYAHPHPGHHSAVHVAHHAAHAHAGAAAAAHASGNVHSHQARSSSAQHPAVLMSMSSIGFGVAPASSADATEAVIRAVQDSMERSAVRLPTAASLRQSLSIHLKLGVPPRPTGEPMHVDVSRLFLFLPQSVPLLPVEIVVGGLLIDHNEAEEVTSTQSEEATASSKQPTICTAVACVTLQQSAPEAAEHSQGATVSNPGGQAAISVPPQRRNLASVSPRSSCQMLSNHTTTIPQPVHRSNSMEVLAQVSGEIRDRQLSISGEIPHAAAAALAMVCINETASYETASTGISHNRSSFSSKGSLENTNAYSYKKLAPGMTPKNNKRLFVRHTYKDYSREEPLPEEQFLVRSESRTPNAAFPLKLHETLETIEKDNLGHIISWVRYTTSRWRVTTVMLDLTGVCACAVSKMPHGRSFKIHNQQDFVDIILPRYFVMTKKSSFLRQLNLYSFNRISVGPDSGSYYHEKFLRGLKFLCRRMTRQKVNGNGIRAAGNPDEEPTLANYPTCPPSLGLNSCSSSVSRNDSEIPEADNDSHEQPYSRLVGSQQTRTSSHGTLLSSNSEGEATMPKEESPPLSDTSVSPDNNGTNKKSQVRIARTDSSASQASFPLKLQRILDKTNEEGRTDIISWLPHGKAFLVHDVDRFVTEVMSLHFNQTKYSSFQRQLHMYNFQRITFGRDKGAYHHDKFQRGRPDLCMTMVRTRVNGKGCRRPGDPDNEPDFYIDWEQVEDSPGGENKNDMEDGHEQEDEAVKDGNGN